MKINQNLISECRYFAMQLKSPTLILIFALITTNQLFSQNISINTTGAAPDSSSILDISSTSKGLLIPRLTVLERNAIVSPATGLIIYNTSNHHTRSHHQ